MRISLKLILILVLTSAAVSAQSPIRRLPAIINHPSLNLYAPYVSADGNALLFLSDNGEDRSLIVNYTSRTSDWQPPTELPKHVNNRLNFLRGYALSNDGKKLYTTSAKSPTIGGYDIMISDLKGSTWSPPVNLMLPINSKSNDACPSLSPDEKMIFFMRCDQMDQIKAGGCKIFMSKKKSNGQWEDPVELPGSINTGNSQTPRILADGQTLIFSSDKMGVTKGGMDLYVSRLANGQWSNPVPLDFVNTERDDQYVTVSANGKYLLKEAKGPRNNFELTEFLMPADLRPKSLTHVEGTITGEGSTPVAAYISVMDLQTKKRIYSGRPAKDGSYSFYLPEGSHYEMSVDPEQSNVSFYSKYFDLRGETISQKEKVNVVLSAPQPGDEISLDLITFKPYSSELDPSSKEELKRFARLVNANPDHTFEVQVALSGLRRDTIQSSQDLTETTVDPVEPVSTDSVENQPVRTRTTYHNDRTLKQAEAINNFLVAEGVSTDQVHFVLSATESESADELPTVRIKAVVR